MEKKREKSSFYEEKSLVGLTPGLQECPWRMEKSPDRSYFKATQCSIL